MQARQYSPFLPSSLKMGIHQTIPDRVIACSKVGFLLHSRLYLVSRVEQHEITEEEDLGLDGGRKHPNEAHQCAVDASKFLRHASTSDSTVNWYGLINDAALKSYLEKLIDDGIGIDGQLEKIERIRYAIAFSLSEARLDQGTEKDLQKMDQRLKKWQSSLRKTRMGEQMRREQEQIESPPHISGMTKVMSYGRFYCRAD